MTDAPTRYFAVDALRGLLVVLMAIDHAMAYIARQHASEFWNGAVSVHSDARYFLTRWVTHLCAPGFFLLLGAGSYWFADSRRQVGWSTGRTCRQLAIRGLTLLACGQLLENPALYVFSLLAPAAMELAPLPIPPPSDGTTVAWGFSTLSALGGVTVGCAVLLRLPAWTWAVAVGLGTVATHTVLPADGGTGSLPLALLFVPGTTRHVFVLYPLIPWLTVTAAGLLFAKWWAARPDHRNWVWAVGLAIAAVGFGVRAAGGWGNLVPARDASWMEFLNMVKYPPSLAFWAVSVGLNLLLLAVLQRLPGLTGRRSPLVVFGQAPLFAYLMHYYLLAAVALLAVPVAAPVLLAWVVWAGVLLMLYLCAYRYREFKSGRPPESVWRFF